MPVSANGTLQTYSISIPVQLRYTGFLLIFTNFIWFTDFSVYFLCIQDLNLVHLDTRLTDPLSFNTILAFLCI
jgi:hypothetical protein